MNKTFPPVRLVIDQPQSYRSVVAVPMFIPFSSQIAVPAWEKLDAKFADLRSGSASDFICAQMRRSLLVKQNRSHCDLLQFATIFRGAATFFFDASEDLP